MEITRITKQTRNTDRLNLFVDNEYFCSISTKSLLKLNLYKSKPVTENDLINIKEQALADLLKSDSYRYLSIKSRSSQEIKKYLKRRINQKYKDFNHTDSDELISKTLDSLTKEGLLDDDEFTKQFIKTRLESRKPESINSLKLKLSKKGIDIQTINKHIDNFEINPETEFENAKLILGKRFNLIKSRAKNQNDLKNKSIRHLISKGYPYQISINAFDSIHNPS